MANVIAVDLHKWRRILAKNVVETRFTYRIDLSRKCKTRIKNNTKITNFTCWGYLLLRISTGKNLRTLSRYYMLFPCVLGSCDDVKSAETTKSRIRCMHYLIKQGDVSQFYSLRFKYLFYNNTCGYIFIDICKIYRIFFCIKWLIFCNYYLNRPCNWWINRLSFQIRD